MKVWIWNDTFETYRSEQHFGCQIVMESFKEQLDMVGVELIGATKIRDCQARNYAGLGKADLVLVNGEGSLHHDRRPDLIDISERFPCILMNTVYDSNSYTAEQMSGFKAVYAREHRSAEQMPVPCEVMPDVFLTNLRWIDSSPRGEGTAVIDHFSDIRTLQPASSLLSRVLSKGQIATGSFHGILLAALTGMPVSAWASNTHKNISVLEDMGIPHVHYGSKSEAIFGEKEVCPISYIINGVNKIDTFFEELWTYA